MKIPKAEGEAIIFRLNAERTEARLTTPEDTPPRFRTQFAFALRAPEKNKVNVFIITENTAN